MADLDKVGMKLHRGLMQMATNSNGLRQDPLYTSNGYLRWDAPKVIRALEYDNDKAIEVGELRILLKDGVWQVPPSERAKVATRLDLVYPIS